MTMERDPVQEVQPQTKRTVLANKAVLVALIAIALGLGVFFKWSFANENVLVVNNNPFPTRSIIPTPEANGVIILDVDYCKRTEKSGVIRTSFVSDTEEIFLPLVRENYSEGCHRQEFPILIPRNLPEDDYRVKFVVSYDINPLKQNVIVAFSSREFHVNPEGSQKRVEGIVDGQAQKD